ncbi:hypothetical protein B0H13DRAFT_2341977 [Mycena leptocephala]|nr:hypothetical protein B0H13DRAFT_2341977 [Mycena leptocephala]
MGSDQRINLFDRLQHVRDYLPSAAATAGLTVNGISCPDTDKRRSSWTNSLVNIGDNTETCVYSGGASCVYFTEGNANTADSTDYTNVCPETLDRYTTGSPVITSADNICRSFDKQNFVGWVYYVSDTIIECRQYFIVAEHDLHHSLVPYKWNRSKYHTDPQHL